MSTASDTSLFAILFSTTVGVQLYTRAGGDGDWMQIAGASDPVFIGEHAGLACAQLATLCGAAVELRRCF
jgi:hypothetical protein